MSDVTQILEKVKKKEDPDAAEELLCAVYRELHALAQSKMNNERTGHTLQATVLVHDAWLKLVSKEFQNIENRSGFFKAAAGAMRRILIDHARRRNAIKRGERQELSETEFAKFAHPVSDETIMAVGQALECFEKTDPQTARLVELRFFVGMTMEEASKVLEIPLRTAQRDYAYFTAWLRRELGDGVKI